MTEGEDIKEAEGKETKVDKPLIRVYCHKPLYPGLSRWERRKDA